jgi:hypothetical protein
MTITSTQTITEFLEARIAEDEAAARLRDVQTFGAEQRAFAGVQGVFDPARVLAECEAKRRIVAALEDERQRKDIYNRDFDLGLLTTEGDFRSRLSANARWAGLDVAVRALASVYADHRDFRDEWNA